MRRVLAAIREEKKWLRLHIARLEDAEALLKRAEPVEAAREPTAARRASSRRKRTTRALLGTTSQGQSPTSDEVRDYVLSHSPTTRRQLLDALGGPAQRMDNKLKSLVSRGAIVAEGQRGTRRYLTPPTSGRTRPQSRFGAAADDSLPDPPQRGVYPLYDTIIDLGSPTTDELAGRLNKSPGQIVQLARRLLKQGLIRYANDGDARRWRPTHRTQGGPVK